MQHVIENAPRVGRLVKAARKLEGDKFTKPLSYYERFDHVFAAKKLEALLDRLLKMSRQFPPT